MNSNWLCCSKNKYLLKELEDRSQIAQKSIDAEGSLTASNEKWEEQKALKIKKKV